ncbi:MAG: hypothetical protein M3Y27_22960 [Acidobacteriota bacterium]|nr:hypothetical protein [Acidobacteriota bacterium]
MTVDERIEALTARHEALTQSVELITLDIRAMQTQQKIRDARIDQLHGEMMLAIARLANTTDAHNGQLANHQDRIERLEQK